MLLEINDIEVFFFGSPESGFSSYPKRYVNIVNAYDIARSENEYRCNFNIISNKFIINYVEYGLRGITSDNHIRGGRVFGIRIELDGYKIKKEGQEKICSYLEGFIELGIKKHSGLFDVSLDYKQYSVSSFNQVSDKLDLLIIRYKENFLIDFKEFLIPIIKTIKEKEQLKLEINPLKRKNIEQHKKSVTYSNSFNENSEKSNKLKKRILRWILPVLLTIIFYLLIIQCHHFINVIFPYLIGLMLILIIYYKFSVKNSKKDKINNTKNIGHEHFDDDNRFITICFTIAVFGVILGVCNKKISDNNSDISRTICNSLNPQEIIINTLDTIPIKYTLCFDNSGSGKTTVDKPNWFNQHNIDAVYYDLNIEKPNRRDDPLFVDSGQKMISNLKLMKLKALKLVTTFNDKDVIDLVLFGNNAIIEHGYNKKKLAKRILELEAKNEYTNFRSLFKRLNNGKNTYVSMYTFNTDNISIFSDFLHETNHDILESKKIITSYIDSLNRKAIGFSFTFFKIDSDRSKSKKIIDVRELLINTYKEKGKSLAFFSNQHFYNIRVYNTIRSKVFLEFLYKNNGNHEEVITAIKFDDCNNRELAYLNFEINPSHETLEYYYSKNNVNEWKPIFPKDSIPIQMNQSIRIKCRGSKFDLDEHTAFTVFIPSKKMAIKTGIIFRKRISKRVAYITSFLISMISAFLFVYIISVFTLIINLKKNTVFENRQSSIRG